MRETYNYNDTYASILRSHPGDMSQHQETYNRNSEAWHCTYVRINELIQEAEQVFESREGQMTQWSQFKPPRHSLIPPGHSTGSPSLVRSEGENCQGQQRPPGTTPQREQQKREGGTSSNSPLSPDRQSQKEERHSVIDAVKQITGALRGGPRREGVPIGETPEYDWDSRYDGIHGFPTQLKNRVSEPSAPQRGQSPREGPQTPPEPQR